ncbi:MAG: cation:proton antiporter [Archaeoglobaceae archaeon]
MDIALLQQIIIIFGLSVVVVYTFNRLNLPTIVGFILTGVLVGPHGLELIKMTQVESLAELGVILLLFTIGIEFSLDKLSSMKNTVLVGGALQVIITILAGFAIAQYLGRPIGESVFIGFLLSLSSTAIVLKTFQERAEVETPHGHVSLGILIFQDVAIVLMILFTPMLTGEMNNLGYTMLQLLAKGMAIILLVIIGARWVVPFILYQIAKTRSRELFLLTIIVIGLSIAWITSSVGLSLALGAFLAGLIISESEYSHQVMDDILPFRDVFLSFFFISIGTLLNVSFFYQYLPIILLIFAGILVIKAIMVGAATTLLGYPLRTVVLVALALSQIGEFSFILSKTGLEYGLLTESTYQLFLSTSVLTMAATPFIISIAPRFSDYFLRLPIPSRLKTDRYDGVEVQKVSKKDHLIVIGYGVSGKHLAQAARAGNIPYIIIEMNPETVRKERARGEPIYYGDATRESVLEMANIKDARTMVVVINDPTATRRIVELARSLNQAVHIIARTRFVGEVNPLYHLGADEVIPEEFETSVEIFTRVLRKYLVPRDEIDKLVAEIRSDRYEMFRTPSEQGFTDLRALPNVEVSSLRVEENSLLVGKSLAQIDFRRKHEVMVLAISRESNIISNPHADTRILPNDLLIVLGSPDKISRVAEVFQGQEQTNSQDNQ